MEGPRSSRSRKRGRPMTDFICQAQDFNGHMHCGRCKLDWPAGKKDVPGCKPKADPPIGMATMYVELLDTAKRIADSQHAAIGAKLRITSEPSEMRCHAVLMAAAQLIERVYRDERIMALLKGK